MKYIIAIGLLLVAVSGWGQVREPSMLWLKGYGGGASDAIATQVTKTSDGGFILGIGSNSDTGTGNLDSFCLIGSSRTIFLKFNADASILEWSKCYGGDGDTTISFMFPQADGSVVLGGEFLSGYGWGYYISKQDLLGNILWHHAYSKNNGPLLFDMIATPDGGYVMSGLAYAADTNVSIHYGSRMDPDIWVLKLDSSGQKVWSKVIGGNGDDLLDKVVSARNNGVYVFGATSSNDHDCTGNHGGYDAYVALLDSNGNLIWHKDLGGSGNDGGYAGNGYACSNDGDHIYLTTITTSSDGDVSHFMNPGGQNIWTIEMDKDSNILWDNCYGGGGDETPSSICIATDKSLWITGHSQVQGGEVDTAYGRGDAWIVHADSTGKFLSAKVLGSTGPDQGLMIYSLLNGSVITGGYYQYGNGAFPDTGWGGGDAYLAVFASWTTGINELIIENAIKIYPNPGSTTVKIETTQKGKHQLLITDAIGKAMLAAELTDLATVNINKWPKGMYYVQLTDEIGFKTINKLIIK